MRQFAVLTAAATLLLILAGGFVTTTGTGDTIPDWPKSWGRMEAGWPVEWTHRAMAAIVGILVAGLALTCRRPLAWVALGAVVVQALIGGFRIYVPQAAVAVVHAIFAQVVFCALALLAFGAEPVPDAPAARGAGMAATGLVFLQLVAGAFTRHTGAGLAVHLLGAFAVVIALSLFASRLMLTPLRGGAKLLLGLLGAQMLLGFFAWSITAGGFVRSHESPLVQIVTVTSHVAVGALILATTLVLTLRCRRSGELPAPEAVAA